MQARGGQDRWLSCEKRGWVSGLAHTQSKEFDPGAELARVRAELEESRAELVRLKGENQRLQRDVRMLEQSLEAMRLRADAIVMKPERIEVPKESLYPDREDEIRLLQEQLECERRVLAGIEQSRSWKITRPLRALMHRMRSPG